MPDREKVIKGLHYCSNDCSRICPYFDADGCNALLARDALALLKEQERRINELEEKLRLMEYGDQGTLQSGMMPAI